MKKHNPIHDLDREELREYAEFVLREQDTVDWNHINYQKEVECKPMSEIKGFKKFARPIPMTRDDGTTANYRSWIELFLFEFGVFKKANYEPFKLPYNRTLKYKVEGNVTSFCDKPRPSVYQPDTVSNRNPSVFFEIKGHLTTKDDDRGQKYLDIKKQYGVAFVFVLQQEGILLPWVKHKPYTMEDWCTDNGFAYTYYYDLKDYLQSDEYQDLLFSVDPDCIDNRIQ